MTPAPPGRKRTLPADLFASVVVFLVALPLCIGIAQACGVPAEAGIVTGIVGGILVGSLAGSPLQVSGPAAGLIVLVADFLAGAKAAGFQGADVVALLGLTILLAGVLQILAGAFHLGQWFRAVSPAVVEGMLAGIGVTIIAKQFHVMVDDKPPAGIVEGLLTIPSAIQKGFVSPSGGIAEGSGAAAGGLGFGMVGTLVPNHDEAATIGLVTILVLAGWKLLKPKVFKFVPSAVVAVVVAVLINEFARPLFEALGLPVGPAVDDHGGLGVKRVRVSSDLLDSLVMVRWPGWDVLGTALVWKGAVTFALIASAESLLCSVAVDTMHTGPRTKADKELVAQGVGNVVCGALGALPMTGVIVRSSANLDAGAKTRLSAIMHGVWLLLFVTFLPGVLSLIPLSALAAVLVYTGWKLLNLPGVVRLWRQSRGEALVFVLTAATIVATDLLTGVVAGVVVSAAWLVWTLSHLSVRREASADGRRVDVHLEGAGTFLRVPQLAETLDAMPRGAEVHLHLGRLQFVDHAAMTLFETFRRQHEASGGRLHLNWERPDIGGGKPAKTMEELAERPEPIGVSAWRRDHPPMDPI